MDRIFTRSDGSTYTRRDQLDKQERERGQSYEDSPQERINPGYCLLIFTLAFAIALLSLLILDFALSGQWLGGII